MFTIIYDKVLNIELLPCSVVITENSFDNFLLKNNIYFFGNGAAKCEKIITNKNAHFIKKSYNPLYMSILANEDFINKQFSDLAYTEPFYIKEFYNSKN